MRQPFRPAAANLSARPGRRAPSAANRALLFGGALLLLWLAASLMPSTAPPSDAAEDGAPDAGTVAVHAPRPEPSAPSLLRPGTIAAVLLLVGGVGFAVWLRRRQAPGGSGSQALSTVGALSLGTNQQLRLVQCGGEVLLLGVSAGEVRLLKAYPPDAFHTPGGDGAAAPTPAFADLLRTVAVPTRNA